ncbi:MAG: arylsulfotransferase family protein [Salinivenus sp.]
MRLSAVEKGWFVLSVAVLAFLYGVAVGAWKWPPYEWIARATEQAEAAYRATQPTPYADRFVGPRVYDRQGARTPRPARMQPGLTLVTSYWSGGEGEPLGVGAKLLDRRGRTVHEWALDRQALFPDSAVQGSPLRSEIHGTHLRPNGDLLVNLDYVGTVRLDACGTVEWTLPEKTHHSIARAEDGTFWIPGVSAEKRRGSARYPDGYPGVEEPVWIDRILHVAPDGEVLRRIPVLDVLYTNGLARYLVKGMSPHPETLLEDPTHLNDVEPLGAERASAYPSFEAGDLLVSLRTPSLVLVVDPTSLEVKWKASTPFIHQHDPDFLGDGWIGVFDNNQDPTPRGTMLGGSRIVALSPSADSTKTLFPTARSEPFYTPTAGHWQRLDNGNSLLTEARAGRVVEVAPSGRTVWEWIHPPYDDTRVPFVMNGTRHNLTREDVADWPCSSVDSVSTSNQSN